MTIDSLGNKARALEKLIKSVEYKLSLNDARKDILHYKYTSINKRLAQKIGQDVWRQWTKEAIFFTDIIEKNGVVNFTDSGILYDSKTNAVEISTSNRLRYIFQFVALWFLFLFASLLPRKRFGLKKVHLLYGVPANTFNNKLFTDLLIYMKINYTKLFGETNLKVFQHTDEICSDDNSLVFVRNPLLYAIKFLKISYLDKLRFVIKHVMVLHNFLYESLKNPLICLLWKDFAMHAVVDILNKNQLVDRVIITNSTWKQQFLWMTELKDRRFSVDLALYSENTFIPTNIKTPGVILHPSMSRVRVDRIIVWSQEYSNLLVEAGINIKTVIVEPMLWYSPRMPCSNTNKREVFKIAVFDVIPRTKKWEKQTGTEEGIYSNENMCLFLKDVHIFVKKLEKLIERPIEVYIKHKRIEHPSYEQTYFKFVSDWVSGEKNVFLVDSNVNLYDFISNCDLIISPPFSSPVHIAASLGVKSLYYHPCRELSPVYPKHEKITFVTGQERLLKFAEQSLN